MRGITPCAVICIALGWCSTTAGQNEPKTNQPTAYVEDGGMSSILQSIVIPSTPDAPFYATLDTEWARPLAGGGSFTYENERHVARDSKGRIYEERWYLVPKNGKYKSTMYFIQVVDPTAHDAYWCRVRTKTCDIRPYYPIPNVEFGTAANENGVVRGGQGFATKEDLGKQTIAGIDTIGIRETTTINPWVAGNDRPMNIVHEYWHSAALNINLLSTVADPRLGTESFTITAISTSEPEAQLFQPPAGYKIIDTRPKPQSSQQQ